MEPVAVGTRIVKVGARRRVITVVESYAEAADIVYLGLDGRNNPVDISHRALSRAVERGDAVLIGGEAMVA